ncbi:hypothetical protein [Variovorax sp. PBL-E5]|uniref:hypothetical protein n=1 Tax=Variovorax sp. PBL-E5 TaxID=434014 RepID=UPI0013163228|nr:hypothetical protein [Variovorax sp. PBL-E5]VTU45321.1 hypothetical protein E5P2_00116 [Variovorax sp. PBL-E5]
MKKSAARWKFKYASLALAASLAACGGGGGGNGGSGSLAGFGSLAETGGGNGTGTGTGGNSDNAGGVAATGAQISGVAAMGAPLVGSVTVKDSLGATRMSPIGTNGAYTVDVGGMTAPFVFRAEGTVNGMTVTVHSVATEADIDGKINITQLTNLVVSNIAGQIAANYFDKFDQSGNAGLASKALVDAEVSKLKEKLLPVLTALGVDAAIDLLHGTFTPLADPIDKALDVIRVQYDTAANTATISNILNAITVLDDLSKQAAAEPSPATLSSDNVVTGLSDQALVKKVLEDFSAKFATGLPNSSDLSPLMTSTFMWNDQNRATWLNQFIQASDFIGISFTDIEIHQIDYSDPTKITAHVSLTPKTGQGIELGRIEDWKIRKGTDGIWRLHGDQRDLDLDWFATTSLHHGMPGASAVTCTDTGIEFNIVDRNNANNGGTIKYILVTGAGLPAGGLRYEEPVPGERWKIVGRGIETYVMASDCPGATTVLGDAAIAAIPDDSVYTLKAYDSAGTQVVMPTGTPDGAYRMKVQRRPLTLAEAAAPGVFPVIAPDTVTAFNSFTSGTLAFSASNVYPLSQATVQMRRQDAAFAPVDQVETSVLPAAAGTVSTTLNFLADPQVASSTMWVESPDRYRRNIQSYYFK